MRAVFFFVPRGWVNMVGCPAERGLFYPFRHQIRSIIQWNLSLAAVTRERECHRWIRERITPWAVPAWADELLFGALTKLNEWTSPYIHTYMRCDASSYGGNAELSSPQGRLICREEKNITSVRPSVLLNLDIFF